jgi:Spy/CpxP family protein refolding chaperone
MRRRVATWLSVALIAALFLGGVGVGIAVDRLWLAPSPPEVTRVELPRRLERFARRLDLTADQADRIRAILEESRSRIGRETEAARQKILELLTPDQAERYRRMVERRKMRRHGRRGRRR